MKDRARGAFLGLAVGDAVGTTVEFRARGSFPPVTDLVGGGPFGLPAGSWTDDTSMALCLADSLLDVHGFDAHNLAQRFARWYRTGYRSSTGACFDIGNTTREALERFERTGDPWAGSANPRSAGNGSIMRLAPAVLAGWPDRAQCLKVAVDQSRVTHAASACLDACRVLAATLYALLEGRSLESALPRDLQGLAPEVAAIVAGSYRTRTRDQIQGSGYVVECLEAALWCVHHATDFRDAVLKATNLGDDADTTAAVAGQLAGARWGASGIPAVWRARVFLGDEIEALADRLLDI